MHLSQRASPALLYALLWLNCAFIFCSANVVAPVDQSVEPRIRGTPDQCASARPFLNSTKLPDECEHPIPHTCRYYVDCAEHELVCGPRGYPLGYGFHYCTRFQDHLDEFSPAGQAWVIRTMTCLQHALIPVVIELAQELSLDPKPECGFMEEKACVDLKDIAFESHPGCYVDSGVCNLRFVHDYLLIAKIVGVQNFFTAQAFQTAWACLRQWTHSQSPSLSL